MHAVCSRVPSVVYSFGFPHRRGHRTRCPQAEKVNVLDSFDIDYSLCMYCGICVDVCPFDALEWDQHRALISDSRVDLTLGITQLTSEKDSAN